jgi:hypothetical protein
MVWAGWNEKGYSSSPVPAKERRDSENFRAARIVHSREVFEVIPARIERATYSLEGCCSIQLSYGIDLFLQQIKLVLLFPNSPDPACDGMLKITTAL